MALALYFARHAEAHNPRSILYGRLPRVDLSANGRIQALALAEALAQLRPRAIFQSPLLRARRTAAFVSARHPGVPVRRSSLLLENRHPFEGRRQAEVAELRDRVYDPDVLGETGETILDLRDRLVRFVRRVSLAYAHGELIAVAHADPLAALRAHLLGRDLIVASLRQEAPPLTGVFKVEVSEGVIGPPEWYWRPATSVSQTESQHGAIASTAGERPPPNGGQPVGREDGKGESLASAG